MLCPSGGLKSHTCHFKIARKQRKRHNHQTADFTSRLRGMAGTPWTCGTKCHRVLSGREPRTEPRLLVLSGTEPPDIDCSWQLRTINPKSAVFFKGFRGQGQGFSLTAIPCRMHRISSARSVQGWGTAWEALRVLSAFHRASAWASHL